MAAIFPIPELGFFVKNRFFGFFAFAHFYLLVWRRQTLII